MADTYARENYVAEWECSKCKQIYVMFCKPSYITCSCKNIITESKEYNMSEKEYGIMKAKLEKEKRKKNGK